MCRQNLWVPNILHFEPSLDASSLQSDVINSFKILSQGAGFWTSLSYQLPLYPAALSFNYRPVLADCRHILQLPPYPVTR